VGGPRYAAELRPAVARVPGASLSDRDGYVHLALTVPETLPGLSKRTATLLEAFPAREGRREVRIDVRNRQWAAMALELLEAAAAGL
jgi:hypothetical protein